MTGRGADWAGSAGAGLKACAEITLARQSRGHPRSARDRCHGRPMVPGARSPGGSGLAGSWLEQRADSLGQLAAAEPGGVPALPQCGSAQRPFLGEAEGQRERLVPGGHADLGVVAADGDLGFGVRAGAQVGRVAGDHRRYQRGFGGLLVLIAFPRARAGRVAHDAAFRLVRASCAQTILPAPRVTVPHRSAIAETIPSPRPVSAYSPAGPRYSGCRGLPSQTSMNSRSGSSARYRATWAAGAIPDAATAFVTSSLTTRAVSSAMRSSRQAASVRLVKRRACGTAPGTAPNSRYER